MKKSLLLSLVMLASISLKAQYVMTSQKEATEIKKRMVLVSLAEENPKTVSKLRKKPEELEEYRKDIAGENSVLKYAVDKYWTLGNQVVVMPASEASAEVKSNPGKYVVLRFGTYTEWTWISTGAGVNGARAGWSGSGTNLTYNPSTRTSSATNQIAILRVDLDGEQVAKVSLPNIYPSQGDAVYAVQQLQYVVNFMLSNEKNKIQHAYNSEARRLAPALKNMTVLIPKSDVDQDLTQEEIAEIYPYPFKLATFEQIEEAILKKEPGLAFVQLITMDSGRGNVNGVFVSGAEDGRIYLFDFPQAAVTNVGMVNIKTNHRIKSKQIKTIAQAVSK